jgi:SAM-dependent methyltransferase
VTREGRGAGGDDPAPSPFVMEHLALAPPGPALDVACGTGRHALAIARTGRAVDAVDRSPEACATLGRVAAAAGLPVRVVCADVCTLGLPRRRYAAVIDTLYLERGVLPALVASLLPGGVLLFETFVAEQLATGHPRNPAYVLGPNELLGLVPGLRVLAFREGPVERDGRIAYLASLAARASA